MRVVLTVVTWFCLSVVVSPPTRAAEPIAVPFQKTERGLFLVDVRINDQGPFPFLVDTGATTSVVFEPLANQLKLSQTRNEFAIVHGIVESGEHPLARLTSFQIGDARLTNLDAIVLRSPSVQRSWRGIVGLNFLSEFVVVFDNRNETLSLYPHDNYPRRMLSSWRKLPVYHDRSLRRPFKLMFVPVRVDGKKIDGLIDLGSTTLILNWRGARLIGFDRLYRRLEEKWFLEGATGEFRPRTVIKDAEIRMGSLVGKGSMLVADTRALLELNRQDVPFLILSAGIFGKGRFAVDARTPAFYFKPVPQVRDSLIYR